jgi:REP element-mobilizing transposase RayT
MPSTAHFVTLSTHRRRFVLRGEPRAIAHRELAALPCRCPGTAVDCAVFLPDRLHAILRLTDEAATVAAIVQSYKAMTTKTIKAVLPVDRVWDRGFAHYVIRDEADLIAVRAALRSAEASRAECMERG